MHVVTLVLLLSRLCRARILLPYAAQYTRNQHPVSCSDISWGLSQPLRVDSLDDKQVWETSRPSAHSIDRAETAPVGDSDKDFVQVYARTEEELLEHLRAECGDGEDAALTESSLNSNSQANESEQEGPANETKADVLSRPVISGPSANRIDIVFMGDGYTATQHELFVSDMLRLIEEMFTAETFKSYLPIMNLWLLFRTSTEEGIGVNSVPKDTAFGLVREGTTLRALQTTKPQAARDACRAIGRFACDFPSLIANDEFYGGLGGEFVIATKSRTSGTIVLRHEMGHNFALVGEEYDGGTAYFGANFAQTTNDVKWQAWLTEPDNIREQKSRIAFQSYPWRDLSQAWELRFDSPGGYSRFILSGSLSGCEASDVVRIELDGKDEGFYKANGTFDRTFFHYISNKGLAAGQHLIKITQMVAPPSHAPLPAIRQLCNIQLTEYGSEDEYVMENQDYIGFFPTRGLATSGKNGFRPMSEKCLMRNMTAHYFCPVCYESIWLQFFRRMSLIDGVTVARLPDSTEYLVTLSSPPLAQFRPGGAMNGERLSITWWHEGVEQKEFQDKESFPTGLSGSWSVRVQLATPEVRSDPEGLLTSQQDFEVLSAPLRAVATMQDSFSGRRAGQVVFEQWGRACDPLDHNASYNKDAALSIGGVCFRLELNGLAPGSTHAVYIHQHGNIQDLGGAFIGQVFNPYGERAGGCPPGLVRKAGSLGNVKANGNGQVKKSLCLDLVQVAQALSAITPIADESILGRAISVHAKPSSCVPEKLESETGTTIMIGVIGVAESPIMDCPEPEPNDADSTDILAVNFFPSSNVPTELTGTLYLRNLLNTSSDIAFGVPGQIQVWGRLQGPGLKPYAKVELALQAHTYGDMDNLGPAWNGHDFGRVRVEEGKDGYYIAVNLLLKQQQVHLTPGTWGVLGRGLGLRSKGNGGKVLAAGVIARSGSKKWPGDAPMQLITPSPKRRVSRAAVILAFVLIIAAAGLYYYKRRRQDRKVGQMLEKVALRSNSLYQADETHETLVEDSEHP